MVNDVNSLFDDLKIKVADLQRENDRLREENLALKEGTWEKNEVKKYKEQYEKMFNEYYSGFPITSDEHKAIHEWKEAYLEKHDYKKLKMGMTGAIFHFEFYPTSLGTIGKIVAPLESFCFRDLN